MILALFACAPKAPPPEPMAAAPVGLVEVKGVAGKASLKQT